MESADLRFAKTDGGVRFRRPFRSWASSEQACGCLSLERWNMALRRTRSRGHLCGHATLSWRRWRRSMKAPRTREGRSRRPPSTSSSTKCTTSRRAPGPRSAPTSPRAEWCSSRQRRSATMANALLAAWSTTSRSAARKQPHVPRDPLYSGRGILAGGIGSRNREAGESPARARSRRWLGPHRDGAHPIDLVCPDVELTRGLAPDYAPVLVDSELGAKGATGCTECNP